MVATPRPELSLNACHRMLSVPFSSGQWLLLHAAAHLLTRACYRLSVPFSSGQWLLPLSEIACVNLAAPCWTFSPLFIGAMVATEPMETLGKFIAVMKVFQSPFHRGNGCYHRLGTDCGRYSKIVMLSVPFSSGQWLLRFSESRRCSQGTYRIPFSPLFIGAMVAT